MGTGERVCVFLTLLGAAMATAPFMAEEALAPMGNGRFAMAFVGVIMSLSSFISLFFLRGRNRTRRDLLAGRQLLVRWTYSEAEWRAFAGEETSRQAGSKRVLLGVTAVFMAIVTVAAIARDRNSGLFIGAVMLVVWVLCWITARISVRAQARHEKGPTPEVRIGRDGLLIGDELHDWRGWGATLEECNLREGPPAMVEFTYATISGNATVRRSETVRVLVPAGQESGAAEVVRKFQT